MQIRLKNQISQRSVITIRRSGIFQIISDVLSEVWRTDPSVNALRVPFETHPRHIQIRSLKPLQELVWKRFWPNWTFIRKQPNEQNYINVYWYKLINEMCYVFNLFVIFYMIPNFLYLWFLVGICTGFTFLLQYCN